MEQIEREAAISSLTHLESYYQSRYEHYLAMATEAKENKERVGLLLLDLDKDVSYPVNLAKSSFDDIRRPDGSASHRSLNNQRVNLGLPQADPEFTRSSPAPSVVDEEKEAPSSVEQMKRWTLDLFKAMSVIESVSKNDSGKALHQNYLHHLINRELGIELSSELLELYLEEAIRRGYLEPDEFNNDCYIAKVKAVRPRVAEGRKGTRTKTNDSGSEAFLEQNENMATDKATTAKLSGKENGRPYDLPDSDKLKPTLFETIEGYMEKNRPKRFSIDDVINYLYSQPIQSDWDKALKNKVRISISNVLSRKAYLGKHWSRIKPGVFRPRI